jgi:ABC-type nitrate/sulfonate/bicarbonate transport system permease component
VLSGTPFIAGPPIEPAGAVPRDPADPALLGLHARLVAELRASRHETADHRLGLLLGWEAGSGRPACRATSCRRPRVFLLVLVERFDLLLAEAAWTAAENADRADARLILGATLAIVFAASAGWRRWALPLVIVSQAIPVIAIAPLLVVWLGYGMASKVVMAAW